MDQEPRRIHSGELRVDDPEMGIAILEPLLTQLAFEAPNDLTEARQAVIVAADYPEISDEVWDGYLETSNTLISSATGSAEYTESEEQNRVAVAVVIHGAITRLLAGDHRGYFNHLKRAYGIAHRTTVNDRYPSVPSELERAIDLIFRKT